MKSSKSLSMSFLEIVKSPQCSQKQKFYLYLRYFDLNYRLNSHNTWFNQLRFYINSNHIYSCILSLYRTVMRSDLIFSSWPSYLKSDPNWEGIKNTLYICLIHQINRYISLREFNSRVFTGRMCIVFLLHHYRSLNNKYGADFSRIILLASKIILTFTQYGAQTMFFVESLLFL